MNITTEQVNVEVAHEFKIYNNNMLLCIVCPKNHKN